jgi:CBS-domain-containing membrane protein
MAFVWLLFALPALYFFQTTIHEGSHAMAALISEAKSILTKYNINALPVTHDDRISGIITRQIAEKAAFHKLERSR